MPLDPGNVAVLREHMQWAYRFAIFWDVLALAVFGGGYALATIMELNGENRTVMAVMLGTLLILNAMWQAAGLLLSRFHTVVLRGTGGVAR
jgi:hypothetical protein